MVLNISGFRICQVSAYCKHYTSLWICLNKLFWLWQGSEYAFFRAWGGFMELCTSIKIYQKHNKKEPSGKHLGVFFLLDTLKNKFWMNTLIQIWTQSGPFIPKSGQSFWFSKKDRGGLPHPPPPTPLVARLSLWLNMYQYPWIPLNFLGNAWINCSNYIRALNMADYLTCSTAFWRFEATNHFIFL